MFSAWELESGSNYFVRLGIQSRWTQGSRQSCCSRSFPFLEAAPLQMHADAHADLCLSRVLAKAVGLKVTSRLG